MPSLPRLLATLSLLVPSLACAQNQRFPPIPISGRVLNAAAGEPIPGASVHYMGVGNVTDQQKRVLNPNTLRGEVRTASDGRYTLPNLPSGDFHVRVSASGFLSDDSNVQSGSARDFRLEPDKLQLQSMSDVALAKFASAGGHTNRDYHASAFSADGDRFAFFSLDTYTPATVAEAAGPPFQRCVAWTYNLKSGVLDAAYRINELNGCDSTAIVWDGDSFYTAPFPYVNPQTGSPPVVERVEAGNVTMLPASTLPEAVRRKFARRAADTAAAQQLGDSASMTSDGQFTVVWNPEGRSWCGPLIVTSTQSHRRRTIATGCTDLSFALDRTGDRVIYTNPLGRDTTRGITEYSLKTGATRVFPLPNRTKQPVFLAQQSLSNGLLRIAYNVNGDCDPASTDYNDMSPEFDLGPTPNQSSVCFITIPAPATPPRQRAPR